MNHNRLFHYLIVLVALAFVHCDQQTAHGKPIHPAVKKMTAIAPAARQFVANNKFNSTRCFMIDMSIPSGMNRLFVYNLLRDSIEYSGLVAHGRCGQRWLEGRKYGNVIGCGCSSLGKYKIGKPYYGRFGLAYKLHGLENSNDMAFARNVVLHAYDCVPEKEMDGKEICQSDGCPMVSPAFMQQINKIIHASKEPVLLWMYE